MSSMDEFMHELFRNFEFLRDHFDLTHAGAYPGPITYGIRYPDPTLFLIEVVDNETILRPIFRTEWEKLTILPPPWPWNEDGYAMMIPPP